MKPALQLDELEDDDVVEVRTRAPKVSGKFLKCEIEDEESYLIALVDAGFTIEAILDMCPIEDDGLLEVITALVAARADDHCSKQ